jgi:hypothetical protein
MVQQVTLNRHFLAKKNVQTKGIHRFCKSGIVPRAVVVSQDQFPVVLVLGRLFCPQSSPYSRISGPGMPFRAAAKTGFPCFPSWLNILPPNPCEFFGIYKTRTRQSFLEGPGRPIGVKRGRIFWLIFHAHMPCTALGAGSACPHFVNPELFRWQPVLARTNFLFDKYGPDRDKFYTTYSSKVPQNMSM